MFRGFVAVMVSRRRCLDREPWAHVTRARTAGHSEQRHAECREPDGYGGPRSRRGVRILYHFRVRVGGGSSSYRGIYPFAQLSHMEFISPTNVDPCTVIERTVPAPTTPSALGRGLQLIADHFPQPLFETAEMAYNLWALPRLLSRLRSRKIDLVYERHAFFNVAGALACKRAGVPLIVEVNELAGHERVRGQTFVGMARRAERLVLRNATLVVTVSDFLRGVLRSRQHALGADHSEQHRRTLGVAPEARTSSALAAAQGGQRISSCS
jgi:hypothetical protein